MPDLMLVRGDIINIIGKGRFQLCGHKNGRLALLDLDTTFPAGNHPIMIALIENFWVQEWDNITPHKAAITKGIIE